MSDRVLRWGLLGTARINRAVIPPLRASQDNRLLAVASRDAASARGLRARVGDRARPRLVRGAARRPRDRRRLHPAAEPPARGVDDPGGRAPASTCCARSRWPSPSAEVDAIEAAAREHGVVVAEAFMYRHHPQTLKVEGARRRRARSASCASCAARSASRSTSPDDVRLRPEWGGGSLWDVGCYPLSFTRFLLGAGAGRGVRRRRRIGPTGIDETFAGQLVFAERRPRADRLRASASAVPGRAGGGRDRRACCASATRGSRSPEQPILLTRGDETEAVPVEAKDRYLLEIEDLAAAVRRGRPPRVSLAESRGNVATIVALLQSAREGRPIRLAPSPWGPGPSSGTPPARSRRIRMGRLRSPHSVLRRRVVRVTGSASDAGLRDPGRAGPGTRAGSRRRS